MTRSDIGCRPDTSQVDKKATQMTESGEVSHHICGLQHVTLEVFSANKDITSASGFSIFACGFISSESKLHPWPGSRSQGLGYLGITIICEVWLAWRK